MKTLEILLEASVMYNRHAAASLNEEDSTGDNILWKESYDERQFLYPRLRREVVTGSLYLMCIPWQYQVEEFFGLSCALLRMLHSRMGSALMIGSVSLIGCRFPLTRASITNKAELDYQYKQTQGYLIFQCRRRKP